MITPTTPLAEDGIGSRTTTTSWEAARGFDRPFARISWGAIIAGAVFALAVQLVLTLVGATIGLASFNPNASPDQAGTALGWGAGIWLLVSSLISLFLGGYLAGRLGGTFNGWLHGLVTWATVTLMSVFLLTTTMSRLVGAATGLASFATNNADKAAQVQLPPAVQSQLDQLKAKVTSGADQAATQGGGKPGEQPTAEKAKEAADKAAKGGAAGTGGASLCLILGALAAAFGGKSGGRTLRHEHHEADMPRATTATGRS